MYDGFTSITIGGFMAQYVEIELDKPRKLRFDINALSDLEIKAGRGIASLLNEEHVGVNSVRMMMWAGLKWEDRSLTIEKVGDLLSDLVSKGQDLTKIGEILGKALQLSGLVHDQGNGTAGGQTIDLPVIAKTGQ